MKDFKIVVLGTAASGKTSFSKLLKGKIKGAKILEINELAKRKGYLSKKRDKYGAREADLLKISNSIRANTRSGVWIITGHLGSEMRIKADIAVVLRTHLKILERRMIKREYQRGKISENLVSEATDYSGIKASILYREVYEVSNQEEKERVANYIKDIIEGRKTKRPKISEKRYLSELIRYIKDGKYGL